MGASHRLVQQMEASHSDSAALHWTSTQVYLVSILATWYYEGHLLGVVYIVGGGRP